MVIIPFAGLSFLLYIGLPFSQDQTLYLPSMPPLNPLMSVSAPESLRSQGSVPAAATWS